MNKAQIQMFESIFVILIFFVMLGMGLIFYSMHASSKLRDKSEEYGTLDAIKVALLAQTAPEFVCTSDRYISNTCFDIYKMEGFQRLLMANSDYKNRVYFGLFGFSKLEVQQVYPTTNSWVLYEREKPGWTRSQSFLIPVGIENATANLIYLGVLKVEVYQ